jgi:DNA-binding NarL/FixJ family response regulator
LGARVGNMRSAVRSESNVKVHLASRDVLTIAGLRQLLKPCAFISVTGTSSDDRATMAALAATNPDVLVLSSTNEQEIGALTTAARSISKALKVVVLADEVLAHQLVAEKVIRLEAVLVRGGEHLEDIGAVLRIVHRGGHVTSSHHTLGEGLHERRSLDSKVEARLVALSPRERLILREVAKGSTNAQIAQPLHVSVATIKADLAHIMSLTRASNRVDLAVQAVQWGIFDEDPGVIEIGSSKRTKRAGHGDGNTRD